MKEREYIEGPEALENFEQFARAILQAPKPKLKDKNQPKSTTRKPRKTTEQNYQDVEEPSGDCRSDELD